MHRRREDKVRSRGDFTCGLARLSADMAVRAPVD